MSNTISKPVPVSTIGDTVTQKAIVNQIVKDAQNLPELIKGLSIIEPDLVKMIQGKALARSKTPWVTAIATAIAFISTKYGFGWDDTTVGIVTEVILLIVSFTMRLLSNVPVTGLFTKNGGIIATTANEK